jgi:hypothetical protein
VNYSLLHNYRNLFHKLQIMRNEVSGEIRDIDVEVTLYVGDNSFPYRTTFTLGEGELMEDLTDRVFVPLTSSLFRTQSEPIRSVVTVKIQQGGRVAYHETSSISVLPVDQWTDTTRDRLWLPSFVLPRDPAVAKIVQCAQRYLMAITDDPSAGFDGYQSVDSSEPSISRACEPVDRQVQAIWAALTYDQRLTYINPPPAYPDAKLDEEQAPQRLRTPSDIMRWQHGTCIDLGLLLCACLEYVDIYPIMFLLKGHAFPGYWRSEDAYRHFIDNLDVRAAPEAGLLPAVSSERNQRGFLFESNDYPRIKNAVSEGLVVPLETVWLTNHSSFMESQLEGRKNLRSRREFDSMLDIHGARDTGVTPLPIMGLGE